MSLFTASLNSGSNGNCYYIGNEKEAILVDAGLSCKETGIRLDRLGIDIAKIKAVFISHEHTDHISGLCVLSRKYQIPVFITPDTLYHSKLAVSHHLIRTFQPYLPVKIGDLLVTAFPKLHDAADPHSFVISGGHVRVGIFTDIGSVCQQVIQNFKTCHAVFLETNYDEQMLENGRYPYSLKNRIRGGKGHISNTEARRLFTDHRPEFMTHLFLSHLSKENNCPDLVFNFFKSIAGETEIIVASRFKETAVYHITHPDHSFPLTLSRLITEYTAITDQRKKGRKGSLEVQLSLF